MRRRTTTTSCLYYFLSFCHTHQHIETHFGKRKGRIIQHMYYTLHNGGGTLFYHKIYSYHVHFFFFLSFSIILNSYDDSILLLFRVTLYSTTQRHENHQQVKKEEEEEDSILHMWDNSLLQSRGRQCEWKRRRKIRFDLRYKQQSVHLVVRNTDPIKFDTRYKREGWQAKKMILFPTHSSYYYHH